MFSEKKRSVPAVIPNETENLHVFLFIVTRFYGTCTLFSLICPSISFRLEEAALTCSVDVVLPSSGLKWKCRYIFFTKAFNQMFLDFVLHAYIKN